jgi:hypothetical protein
LNLNLVDDKLGLDPEKNSGGSQEGLTRAELLTISIYIKSRDPKLPPTNFGKRAIACGGTADLQSVLWAEMHRHVEQIDINKEERGHFLVMGKRCLSPGILCY